MVVQNLHRYFMYAALAYLPLLTYDVWLAINFHEGDVHTYGVSIGTLILLINVIMLTGYTLGCYAFRHVIGGGSNDWTSSGMARLKYKMWKFSTKLNENTRIGHCTLSSG